MNVVKEIQDFMKTCPHLKDIKDGVKRVTLDNKTSRDSDYVITVNPTSPIVRRFLDGTAVRQVSFDIAVACELDKNGVGNIDNNDHFYQISEWLEDQKDGDLLPEGWNDIEAVANGYVFSVQENGQRAEYHMPIVLQYTK